MLPTSWEYFRGVVTNKGKCVGADEDYSNTAHVNVVKPFCKDELEVSPELKPWNEIFDLDRGLNERTFAILKGRFVIFDMPWKRDVDSFPVALRVCIKLLNRYWRLNENVTPGLKRKIDQMDVDIQLAKPVNLTALPVMPDLIKNCNIILSD